MLSRESIDVLKEVFRKQVYVLTGASCLFHTR